MKMANIHLHIISGNACIVFPTVVMFEGTVIEICAMCGEVQKFTADAILHVSQIEFRPPRCRLVLTLPPDAEDPRPFNLCRIQKMNVGFFCMILAQCCEARCLQAT